MTNRRKGLHKKSFFFAVFIILLFIPLASDANISIISNYENNSLVTNFNNDLSKENQTIECLSESIYSSTKYPINSIIDLSSLLITQQLSFEHKPEERINIRIKNNYLELIVGFSNFNFDHNDFNLFCLENDLLILNKISRLNTYVLSVHLNSLNIVLDDLKSFKGIRYIQFNNLLEPAGIPTDNNWTDQWAPQKIDVPLAWDIETGNRSSVLVAVIDSGIDYNHPELSNQYNSSGYDFVNDDADPMDDFGHGTLCAGIIAASINNTIGIAGLANVSIMAEKFIAEDGFGTVLNASQAIMHAVDAGADILSLSFVSESSSTILEDAINYAVSNDVVMVGAAGNDGTSQPNYPSAYSNVIAVSATNSSDLITNSSNYGSHIDLCAPGDLIYSTLPIALGEYGYGNGTSFACAHVVGVVALIKSHFPEWTAQNIRQRLISSAYDLGIAGWDQYYGYGLINASKSLAPLNNHDIMVGVEVPSAIILNAINTINVTTTNIGLSVENDIDLQIWINNTLKKSVIIGSLEPTHQESYQYNWTPNSIGNYNITVFAIPVSGEIVIFDNNITVWKTVHSFSSRVGFLHTKGDIMQSYSLIQTYYEILGYQVDIITEEITSVLLAQYSHIFLGEDGYGTWSIDELTILENFIISGGVLVGVGDSFPCEATVNIAEKYGISFTSIATGDSGATSEFDASHPLLDGVTVLYLPNPYNALSVGGIAQPIIWDNTHSGVYGAYADVGMGHILVLAEDFDDSFEAEDNEILFSNILNWIQQEHDLYVILETEPLIYQCQETIINATVFNRGISNETDVVMQLWIDETLYQTEFIPTLDSFKNLTFSYFWSSTIVGPHNITLCVLPVLDEVFIKNNYISTTINILDLYAKKVAILNSDSTNEPFYFFGGWSNNFYPLYEGLLDFLFNVEIITNEEILSGGLIEVGVLIMVDNAPNAAASNIVKDWYFDGGCLLTFDSSICFNNWAGILPPEAEGTSGCGIYWDYNSPAAGILVNEHPITAGYALGSSLQGTSGDSQYYSSTIQSSEASPYYTPVVKTAIGSDRDLVVAYEPPQSQGLLVHIWDAVHWYTTSNHQLILNSISWLQSREVNQFVNLIFPNGGERISGETEILWSGYEGNESDPLNYTVSYWQDSSSEWVILAENITDTYLIWDTTTVNDGLKYKIRILARNSTFERYDQSITYFIIDNINEAPFIEILSPNGGECLDYTWLISWNASDPDLNLLSFDLYYSSIGGEWIEIRRNVTSNNHLWGTQLVIEGLYQLKIVANDGFLSSEDTSDGYFVINHAYQTPMVDIIEPHSNQIYSGILRIFWESFDPQGDQLYFSLFYSLDILWVELTYDITENYFDWNTATVPNGSTYKVQVIACDGINFVSDITSGYFIIRNKTIPTDEGNISFATNVVIIISVIGSYIVYKKRKTKKRI